MTDKLSGASVPKGAGPKMGAPTPRKKPRRGLVAVLSGACLLLILGGVYIAGYFQAGDNLPRNTHLGGIALGGLNQQQAIEKLSTEYADEAAQPFKVSAGDKVIDVVPADAGLGVDYNATVLQAGAGRSLNPSHIWKVLTGGGEIKPVTQSDQNKLSASVGQIASEVNRPAKDAQVRIEDGKAIKTGGEQSAELDQAALSQTLESEYLDSTEVSADIKLADPNLTNAAADEFINGWAKNALSAPIKVDTGKGIFDVTPKMIGDATTVEAVDNKFSAKVDQAKLYENAKPAIKKLDLVDAKNASYKWTGGRAAVVPSVDGTELKPEVFTKAVEPAISNAQNRTVKVELTVSKAKFNTKMAEEQLPSDVLGEFTTTFPYANYRNVNLGKAASSINGTVVRPGEVFSLNEVLGERTHAKGYVDGSVISNGRLKNEVAGGVSQSATTAYNAAWFAGLKDVEHQPHTLYFDRYPAGREATLYYPSIDLKFENDNGNVIIVEAVTNKASPGGKGSITVRIRGTKVYDIESPTPVKSDPYKGKTIVDDSSECKPQAAADGFTASYYRIFKKNGAVVKREDKTWKYSATNEIKCQ